MKKTICILLAVFLLFSLSGCISKEAAAVDKLILAIGDVSENSGAEIESAENAYFALTEEQKAEIKNYQQLLDARKKYDELFVLPYGIKWGDSFETVTSKEPNPADLVEENSGEKVSTCFNMPPSYPYFGVSTGIKHVGYSYTFNSEDELIKALFHVEFEKESTTSMEEQQKSMIQHFDTVTDMEHTCSDILDPMIFYEWQTNTERISIMTSGGPIFDIVIEQI